MTARLAAAAIVAAALIAPAGAVADGQRYVDPIFGQVEVTRDIEFGSAINNRGDTQALLLDKYEPAGDNATARPAIVFAFGGGFRAGSRDDPRYVALLESWARRGYVAVSIDYRVRPTGTPDARRNEELVIEAVTGTSPTIQDAQHDMQAAVRWVRANAATNAVDPERIVVAGESAGAITAWQTAINPEDPGDSNTLNVPSNVAAAVSLWGAADPDQIERGAPPILDFHGGADTTVPMPFGAQACGIMLALGGVCEMVIWPTEPHAAFGRSEDILATSSRFICRHVVAGCVAPPPPAPVAIH